MKDIISKIMWKIQMVAMTQLFELFLWITISGVSSALLVEYLRYNQHINNVIFEIIFILFIYYSGYKIILK
jgi:hypothetical protein